MTTNIKTIAPRTGDSVELTKGNFLKVICPEGEQVSDMVVYNKINLKEYLSNGKTFDYEETIQLTKGHFLYSNESNKMLEIVDDTCGIHDFLLAPCCRHTMEVFYDDYTDGPTCRKNLFNNLKDYGIEMADIPTAFNIFMNVPVKADGSLTVAPPKAKPGDYIIFKAHMDCIIGLTACSAGASNNNSYKAIQYEVLDSL